MDVAKEDMQGGGVTEEGAGNRIGWSQMNVQEKKTINQAYAVRAVWIRWGCWQSLTLRII